MKPNIKKNTEDKMNRQTDLFTSRANSRIQAKTCKYWLKVQEKRDLAVELAKTLYISSGEHFIVLHISIEEKKGYHNGLRVRQNGWNVLPEKEIDYLAEGDKIVYSTHQITHDEYLAIVTENYMKERYRRQ